jgi:hypothetical protein
MVLPWRTSAATTQSQPHPMLRSWVRAAGQRCTPGYGGTDQRQSALAELDQLRDTTLADERHQLVGGRLAGIDHEVDLEAAECLAHPGVLHPGHGALHAELGGNVTGQHVGTVGVGDGDEQLGRSTPAFSSTAGEAPLPGMTSASTRPAARGRLPADADRIAQVSFLAHRLGKPVLVEGPAGVGKTELAKALAADLSTAA